MGRFLQPDTLVQDPGDPATLNRFSYVLNDPINHNDPTGHCADPLSGTLCMIGVGAAGIAAAPVGLVVLGAVAVVAVLYVTYELTVSANAEQYRQAIANVFAPIPRPPLAITEASRGATVLETRGEYVPRGLSEDERDAYREAVHDYKDAWGIPANVDVPKWILNKIAQAIRDGMSARDAVDDAPEPPEPDVEEDEGE